MPYANTYQMVFVYLHSQNIHRVSLCLMGPMDIWFWIYINARIVLFTNSKSFYLSFLRVCFSYFIFHNIFILAKEKKHVHILIMQYGNWITKWCPWAWLMSKLHNRHLSEETLIESIFHSHIQFSFWYSVFIIWIKIHMPAKRHLSAEHVTILPPPLYMCVCV